MRVNSQSLKKPKKEETKIVRRYFAPWWTAPFVLSVLYGCYAEFVLWVITGNHHFSEFWHVNLIAIGILGALVIAVAWIGANEGREEVVKLRGQAERDKIYGKAY